MDTQGASVQPNLPASSKNPFKKFKDKFANLTKKQKIVGGIVALVILLVLGALFFSLKIKPSPDTTIAKVGNVELPRRYLDFELEYYPGQSNGKTEEELTQKIIDDEVVIQEGIKNGWVDGNVDAPVTTTEGYLERTKKVADLKKQVLADADGIKGHIVSVWFGNATGSAALQNRSRAYAKISPLYERVKNKQITIEEAGRLIARDSSLAALDPGYAGNAITPFDGLQGQKITFWGAFDDLLWKTGPGEVTPLYVGSTPGTGGGEALYVFGKVDEKVVDQGYSDFDQWLKQRRSGYRISLETEKLRMFGNLNLVAEALAQSASPQASSSASPASSVEPSPSLIPSPSASGNSSPSPSPFASVSPDPGIIAPEWVGTVISQTGAPVAGATIFLGSECPGSRTTTTDSNGNYLVPAKSGVDSRCNPFVIRATVATLSCESKTISASNTITTQRNDFTCLSTQDPGSNGLFSTIPRDTVIPANEGFDQLITVEGVSENLSATGLYTVSYKFSEKTFRLTNTPKDVSFPTHALLHKCPEGNGNDRNLYCWETNFVRDVRTVTLDASNDWTQTLTYTIQQNPEQACGSFQVDIYSPITTTYNDDPNMRAANVYRTGQTCPPPPPPPPSPPPPLECNAACQNDAQCARAVNGCTACVNGACKPPPACGTACTTKADCSGAKDSCSECLEGACTNFNDNMCKCDGIEAQLDYPGNFKFEAFGMVKGADKDKAEIADVTFKMTKDGGAVIATSAPITPEIVENNSEKIRFKAAWQTAPPAVSKNSTYRVFATVRCKPKRVTADTGQTFSPVPKPLAALKSYPPKGLELVLSGVNKLFGDSNAAVTSVTGRILSMFSTSTVQAQGPLQLQTLKFIKLVDTDNCGFVRFKFDETLF